MTTMLGTKFAPAFAKFVDSSFDTAFSAAFDSLDRGNNYVKLADLRAALPQFSHDVFDTGLNELRRARLFTCDPSDGRHARVTDEDRAGGIEEGGKTLVWCARRAA